MLTALICPHLPSHGGVDGLMEQCLSFAVQDVSVSGGFIQILLKTGGQPANAGVMLPIDYEIFKIKNII